jgi:hypothetical protein
MRQTFQSVQLPEALFTYLYHRSGCFKTSGNLNDIFSYTCQERKSHDTHSGNENKEDFLVLSVFLIFEKSIKLKKL